VKIILGIHIGYDSSAALVVDRRIVSEVAEELFMRTKHYSGLPIASIDYCLRSLGVSIADNHHPALRERALS